MATQGAGATADAVRAARPLIQCITNYVAMDITANLLLAAGAAPAMVHSEREAGSAHRSALLVNTGTLDPSWTAGMRAAVAACRGAPWVLDPVGVGATAARTETCAELASLKPTAVKGNASEIIALATALGWTAPAGLGGPRGVDSTVADTAAALPAARHVVTATGSIVIVTGEVDRVVDAGGVLAVGGGSPLLPHVTATGCALGALLAAYLAAAGPYHTLQQPHPAGRGPSVGAVACAHACAAFGAAAAAAGGVANGPGSFRVALIDALYNQGAEDVDERSTVTAE